MNMLLVKDMRGEVIASLKLRLRQELGEAAADYAGLATGTELDTDTEAAVRRWQSGVGLVADGIVGPRCQEILELANLPQLEIAMDVAAVRQLFPATKPANLVRYLPYVLAALRAAGLTDRTMICAALGTVRAESEGFVPIPEFRSRFNTPPEAAPFSAYDGRKSLGNTEPGDGARFRGRGFIQLTGRANYQQYGKALGIDLVANPDRANAPEVAATLLATFLANKADAMRAALGKGDFRAARKQVNGGSHGIERFKDVFERAASLWPEPATKGKARKPVPATMLATPAPAGRELTTARS